MIRMSFVETRRQAANRNHYLRQSGSRDIVPRVMSPVHRTVCPLEQKSRLHAGRNWTGHAEGRNGSPPEESTRQQPAEAAQEERRSEDLGHSVADREACSRTVLAADIEDDRVG